MKKEPKKYVTFSDDTRESIWDKYHHVCGNPECQDRTALSIHHIVHNTDSNKLKYGDLIQSQENGILLCYKCHSNHTSIQFIQDLQEKLLLQWELKMV